jgi:hypothetical protein
MCQDVVKIEKIRILKERSKQKNGNFAASV